MRDGAWSRYEWITGTGPGQSLCSLPAAPASLFLLQTNHFRPPPPPESSAVKYQPVVHCKTLKVSHNVYSSTLQGCITVSFQCWSKDKGQSNFWNISIVVCTLCLQTFKNASRFYQAEGIYIYLSKIVRIGIKMNLSDQLELRAATAISWPRKISWELKVNKTQKHRRN